MSKEKDNKKKKKPWKAILKSEVKAFGKIAKNETKEWGSTAFRTGTGTKKSKGFSKNKR